MRPIALAIDGSQPATAATEQQRNEQRTFDATTEEGLALALLEHALTGFPSGWLSAAASRPTRSAASRLNGSPSASPNSQSRSRRKMDSRRTSPVRHERSSPDASSCNY